MKLLLLFLFICILTSKSLSDVVYVLVPGPDNYLANLEVIGSVEKCSYNRFFSLNYWIGGALIFCIPEKHPGIGAEMAFEPRFYFLKNINSNSLFTSLYMGTTLVFSPEFSHGNFTGYVPTVGFTPGVKIGYKRDMNTWGLNDKSIFRSFIEPYFGVSWPYYFVYSWSLFDFPLLSFGIRIGIEKNIFGRRSNEIEVQEDK